MKTLTLLLLISTQAQAFNDSKCDHWRTTHHHDRVFPFSLGTSSTKYGTSSTQFTSSWGACAALGMREQREEFIAENSDALTLEAAQGQGERLEALALLSGCQTPAGQTKFKQALQKNFATLFELERKPAAVAQIAQGIDRLIQATPELVSACQLPG